MARRIRNNSSAPEVFRLSRPSEGAGQVGACARAPNALQHGRGTLGAATRSAPDGALAKQLPANSSPLVRLARLLAREAARASQEGSSETLTPMLVGAPNCNRNTLGADSRPKPVAQALTASVAGQDSSKIKQLGSRRPRRPIGREGQWHDR